MKWKEQITRQIHCNQFTNLLSPDAATTFSFTDETKNLIRALGKGEAEQPDAEWFDQLAKEVLSSFYQLNPYYYFNGKAITDLKAVYAELLRDISQQDRHAIDFSTLTNAHASRLRQWLLRNYPAALLIYPPTPAVLEKKVVYANYRAQTQTEVLGISIDQLKAPILDLGCGKDPHLVCALRSHGLEVYGIDRDATPSSYVFRADWLTFPYSYRTWGTVISHLGFSTHFLHHHLLEDELSLEFAATYRKILQSLKRGGSFYYAPDLPFIETHLDPLEFLVSTKEIKGTEFRATRITRIS